MASRSKNLVFNDLHLARGFKKMGAQPVWPTHLFLRGVTYFVVFLATKKILTLKEKVIKETKTVSYTHLTLPTIYSV